MTNHHNENSIEGPAGSLQGPRQPVLAPGGVSSMEDSKMHRGYIKTWRKLLENPIFRDPALAHLWEYCRLKATHKPRDYLFSGQIIPLKPGQFIFGRKVAAFETGLKESTLYKKLNILEKLGILNTKRNNKFSIVTIINWRLYQSQVDVLEQQMEQQRNNNGTTTEQQRNTDKNVKNEKNVENEKKRTVNFQSLLPDLEGAPSVKINEREWGKLGDKFGEAGAIDRVRALVLYMGSKGKRFKSHYLTILNWERMREEKDAEKGKTGNARSARAIDEAEGYPTDFTTS